MTEEQRTLLEIRGTIAGMTPADQALVKAAADGILAVMAAHPGGHGLMVVVLIGAELAARDA